jgi:hypothetical protein
MASSPTFSSPLRSLTKREHYRLRPCSRRCSRESTYLGAPKSFYPNLSADGRALSDKLALQCIGSH